MLITFFAKATVKDVYFKGRNIHKTYTLFALLVSIGNAFQGVGQKTDIALARGITPHQTKQLS